MKIFNWLNETIIRIISAISLLFTLGYIIPIDNFITELLATVFSLLLIVWTIEIPITMIGNFNQELVDKLDKATRMKNKTKRRSAFITIGIIAITELIFFIAILL